MGYVKAETILPDNLVREIQKYIQGEYVYIPSEHTTRKKWGEKSGTRQRIQSRNEAIRNKHKSGYTIDALSEEFFLSIDSIKKIVYSKNRNEKLSLL
ncbi:MULTISPECIES: CD3324 family protein [Clostridium]|uniref:CD3324 family protein n=1 Tax=Clostridium subterminale TaxID=1550 RepID=A0ABP3W0J8_CLOSU